MYPRCRQCGYPERSRFGNCAGSGFIANPVTIDFGDIFVYGITLFGNLRIRMAFAIDHYFYVSKNLRPGENGMDFSRAIYFLGRLYFLSALSTYPKGLMGL
jgi:hypothetical protein